LVIEIELDVKGFSELQEKLQQLDDNMRQGVHEALQFEAEAMKNVARARCPVRTGRLRDSIYARVEDWILRLGAAAPYAIYQELGTRYIRPRKFLENAVLLRLQSLINRINDALGEAVKEASG
jgi:HK97 gp10 family phage protein